MEFWRSLLGHRVYGFPVWNGLVALVVSFLLARILRKKTEDRDMEITRSHQKLMKIYPHLDPAVRRRRAEESGLLARRPAESSPQPSTSSVETDCEAGSTSR